MYKLRRFVTAHYKIRERSEVNSVDQKLRPLAFRCPASSGLVGLRLQRATGTFLSACTLRGWGADKQSSPNHSKFIFSPFRTLQKTTSVNFNTLPFLLASCDPVQQHPGHHLNIKTVRGKRVRDIILNSWRQTNLASFGLRPFYVQVPNLCCLDCEHLT